MPLGLPSHSPTLTPSPASPLLTHNTNRTTGSMEEAEAATTAIRPLPTRPIKVASDPLAGSTTSSLSGSTNNMTRRVRSLPTLRRRRTAVSLTEPADPPMFLEDEDYHKRSCLSLKDLAESYFRSFLAQLLMFGLSIFSCVLYVVETYHENPYRHLTLTMLEVLLSLSFLVDYILTLAFALDRWRYIVSFNGIIDLVSILPLISIVVYHASYGDKQDVAVAWLEIGSLCRILRGLKVFRVMRFSSESNAYSRRNLTGPLPFDENNTVTARIVTLCFWLCGTIFIATGLVFFIDTHERHKSFQLPPDIEVFTWLDALYFVSVTLATVGYGDITPSSDLSRAVVIFAIFFFLCCIPYQISKLMEAISSKSIYRTAAFRPVRNTEHAVLLGRVTYPVLVSFIEQFLHGDKVLEHNFRLVILSPKEPDAWIRSLLQHPRYQDRVQYLHGSPWNAEDLRRAGAGHAQAIFILADFFAQDIAKDQDRILLTAVAARKYLIRQYDHDIDADSDDDEEEEPNVIRKAASSLGILPPSSRPKANAGAESPASAARRRAKSPAGSYTFASCSSPPRRPSLGAEDSDFEPSLQRQKSLPFLARVPSNSYLRGAVSVLQRGISSLGNGVGQRKQQEADEELSERIVIQTHSTAAMEELTRGLGFRQAYCPHIIRLRLMAYGTVFPGLVSFFMNLLKGDPFLGDDTRHQPEWFRAFRAGARQRVVRHQVLLPPDSPLKGRTFAEVARYLYRWHGIVMVGVEVNGVFLLNPHHFFRFQPTRTRTVMVYFIASGLQVVREALETLLHSHWDRMDLEASLAELPRVGLRVSDLPPPRTTLLEKMQTGSDAHTYVHRKSFSLGCLRNVIPSNPLGRTDSMSGGRGGRDVNGAPPPLSRPRAPTPTYRQAELHQELRSQHREMLAEAHRILREAHEDHQSHTRDHSSSSVAQNRYEASARRGSASTAPGGRGGGEGEEGDDGKEAAEQGPKAREGLSMPPSLAQQQQQQQPRLHVQPPVFVESVVKKVQGARDMLTQLLDVHHSPLPEDGLHDHVVLGLCNEFAPSADAFIQYVSAFRKLLHMPIVVLCADSERFAGLLQGVRQRLRQSSRHVQDKEAPDTHDIFFVKGSPKNKADLHQCCVEQAYAVVLLGDDVPRRRETDGDRDPVLMDRHVLLSCFKLEGILRQRLYSQVLTLVDLRNEQNMDLLRQRVRPPSQLMASTLPAGYHLGKGRSYIPSSRSGGHAHGGAAGGVNGREATRRPLSSQSPATQQPVAFHLNDERRTSTIAFAAETVTTDHGHKYGHGHGHQEHHHHDLHPHNDPHHHHEGDDDEADHSRRRRRRSFSPVPERASRPEQGCPLFAAGRVCCRSFFDVFFIYLYKQPYALKLWKEVIRSRLDDLAEEEFQMGSGVTVADLDPEEAEMMEEMVAEGVCGEEGEEGGPGGAEVPVGYNGNELFMDTTGRSEAPPGVADLQDAIDALRSSLDEMALPRAFIGARYGDLTDALLHLGLVPMGLYRPRGLMDAPMPFSIVNPPPETKLVRADLIFVLRPAAAFDAVGTGGGGGGGGEEGPAEVPSLRVCSTSSPLGYPLPPAPVRFRPER